MIGRQADVVALLDAQRLGEPEAHSPLRSEVLAKLLDRALANQPHATALAAAQDRDPRRGAAPEQLREGAKLRASQRGQLQPPGRRSARSVGALNGCADAVGRHLDAGHARDHLAGLGVRAARVRILRASFRARSTASRGARGGQPRRGHQRRPAQGQRRSRALLLSSDDRTRYRAFEFRDLLSLTSRSYTEHPCRR